MNRNESRKVIMTILEITNDFVSNMVKGVLDKKSELFKIANENLKDWTISRLGFTDQAILSLGIYELLYTDTPDVVAINEAVELAKKYSDDKVKNMINKVLDNIYHKKID